MRTPFYYKRSLLLLLALTLSAPSTALPESTLRIAAASSLRYSLDRIAKQFEAKQNIDLEITYGASGSLLAQLRQGAPFDLFLSADETYPGQLIKKRLASDRFEFGQGRLILWTPPDSKIAIGKTGMQGLLSPAVRKIAIANPAHAPYGVAAISALKHFGLYQKVQPQLVFGEDIAQATHFVESGSAQVGIVSYSLVASRPKRKGHYWLIPSSAHAPLKLTGVILKKSREKPLAHQFAQFIIANLDRISY
jgi:molybdate transport system substrate-binding protein